MKPTAAAIAPILIACLLAACDDKKPKDKPPTGAIPGGGGGSWGEAPAQQAKRPAEGTPLDIVGTWEAQVGKASPPDAAFSKMTIEFHPDNTVAFENVMTDFANPSGPKIVKKAVGSWKETREAFIVTLERSLTGGEIPEAQRVVKFEMFSDAQGPNGGVHIRIDPTGPQFERKAK
jgi:hypothetical protein